MSEWVTKVFTKAIPEGDLRSTAMEDLWRVKRSAVWGGRFDECVLFGIARSIRKTDAPLSARSRPAKGPAYYELQNSRQPVGLFTYPVQARRILKLERLSREVSLASL